MPWLKRITGAAHLVGFSFGGWVAMNQAHPRARPGRLHHAARPRRAHPARRPVLSVVDHHWPGHPDPDAAAPAALPEQARDRGSLMPRAEIAVVPGSHGGFRHIGEVNDQIAAFIRARAAGGQAARPPASQR